MGAETDRDAGVWETRATFSSSLTLVWCNAAQMNASKDLCFYRCLCLQPPLSEGHRYRGRAVVVFKRTLCGKRAVSELLAWVLESKLVQRMIETAPTPECQERVRKRSGDGCEHGPIPIWSIKDE